MPRRTLIYCLLLLAIASALYLPFLSRHPMSGDEPLYAMCSDNMRSLGGNLWLFPTAYPPDPYFQKPPLYMWLTAATSPLFSQDNWAKYRIWSACFGILVVVGTCALGSLLFSPEVGFVAGLLLCLNDDFVRNHGVLTGTFDTGLTLCCLVSFIVYWLWFNGQMKLLAWIIIGLMAGIATLFKPMFGVLPIGLLTLHALLLARSKPLSQRILFPLVAIVIAFAVSSWWYFLQYHHFGQRYIDEVWHQNIVSRIREGLNPRHVKPMFYYLGRITASSIPFVLAIPALVCALISSFRAKLRSPSIFLVFVAVGWLILFSASASKFLHYAYPVFPLIAIAIGVMLIKLGESLRGRWASNSVAVTTFCVVPLLVIFSATQLAIGMITDAHRSYEPFAIYQEFRPAIESGKVQLISYNFPTSKANWFDRERMAMEAKDVFYLARMPMKNIAIPSELTAITKQPSIVILSRYNDLPAQALPLARSRFDVDDPKLLVRTFGLEDVLNPKLGSEAFRSTNDTSKETTQIDLAITPPIACGGILTIRGRAEFEEPVYANVKIGREVTELRIRRSNDVRILVVELDHGMLHANQQTKVQITLPPNKAMTVENMSLALEPRLIR